MSITALVRAYLEEGIRGRDFAVLEQVLREDFTFYTQGVVVAGREQEYIPMVRGHLRDEPTLQFVVREVVTNGDRAGVWMTKFTTAPEAAWDACLLYAWDGSRLTECWSEQDWFCRSRQTRGGESTGPVGETAADVWDVPVVASAAGTDRAAQEWLKQSAFDEGLIATDEVRVNSCFSVGPRFVFHATVQGTYRRGLDGFEQHAGTAAHVHVAGMGALDVSRNDVSDVRTVIDRAGLRRRLSAA